jgi:hypothetical protein
LAKQLLWFVFYYSGVGIVLIGIGLNNPMTIMFGLIWAVCISAIIMRAIVTETTNR